MAEGPPVDNESVRSLPAACRLSLRIKESSLPAPPSIAGLSLDLSINRFAVADGRTAARLGPNEWLIVDAPAAAERLRSDIMAALGDRFHALVDVSHGAVAFAVEGPAAADILNAGCPLDLDLRHFPVGAATRTLLGKCEIILWRAREAGFRVECARSFGPYVQAFLLEAAALNPATHARG